MEKYPVPVIDVSTLGHEHLPLIERGLERLWDGIDPNVLGAFEYACLAIEWEYKEVLTPEGNHLKKLIEKTLFPDNSWCAYNTYVRDRIQLAHGENPNQLMLQAGRMTFLTQMRDDLIKQLAAQQT